jgi:WD40 repeat protein/tetratricopeptide (TPR) repeat protein
MSSDGRLLTAGGRLVRAWDPVTGNPAGSFRTAEEVKLARFSPDGRRVLTTHNSEVNVWDAGGERQVRLPHVAGFPDIAQSPIYASFSADGLRLLTAWNVEHRSGHVRVWSAGTGEPVGPALDHSFVIRRATFGPDSSRVATACGDYTARVWDPASGKQVGRSLRHSASVFEAAFSPDGARVATGSTDRTARVWDATTGDPITPPLRHGGYVYGASFSPDGKWLATASGLPDASQGEVRLWDAATGEPLSPPLPGAPWGGHAPSFTPDGSRLVADAGGGVFVWDLTPSNRRLDELREVTRLLSAKRIDATGATVSEEAAALLSAWESWRARHPEAAGVASSAPARWHRRQAAEAIRRGQWFAADWHSTRLITSGEADSSAWAERGDARLHLGDLAGAAADLERAEQLGPPRWTNWAELGDARARLGDLAAASAAYARATELPGADAWAWYRRALLQACDGDVGGYRTTCAAAVDRFLPSGDEPSIGAVAMACELQDGAVADLGGLIAALRGARGGKGRSYLGRVGALLLRSGDPAGAVKTLEEARAGLGQGDGPWQWLPLALAHDRLGHKDQARDLLRKATAWLEGPAGRDLAWNDRLGLDLLRREAAARIPAPGEDAAKPR